MPRGEDFPSAGGSIGCARKCHAALHPRLTENRSPADREPGTRVQPADVEARPRWEVNAH